MHKIPNYHSTEPLVVVTNANSTKAKNVESEVLRPLQESGVAFSRVDTRFRLAGDNVKDLIDRLPEQGRVISAAGDGTAEQLATVALQKQNIVLGVLPYGNYNDTAFSHMNKNQTVFDFLQDGVPRIDRHPITIEANGESFSETFSYATFGLTAIIAAGFRDEPSRERLRKASPAWRSILRYGQAGVEYLRYSGDRLPNFQVNSGDVQTGRTDLAFANNSTVAGLLRFPDEYFDKEYFGVRTNLNMKSLHDIVTFGVPSLFGRAPLERARAMHIRFEETAHALPFQSGGEYQEIDADSLFVYKDPSKRVSYLHPRRS